MLMTETCGDLMTVNEVCCSQGHVPPDIEVFCSFMVDAQSKSFMPCTWHVPWYTLEVHWGFRSTLTCAL